MHITIFHELSKVKYALEDVTHWLV